MLTWGHIKRQGVIAMPLTHFIGLVGLVILAAGVTLALAAWAQVPMVALGFAALSGSLILGWNRLSR
jgi:hypothetical protein